MKTYLKIAISAILLTVLMFSPTNEQIHGTIEADRHIVSITKSYRILRGRSPITRTVKKQVYVKRCVSTAQRQTTDQQEVPESESLVTEIPEESTAEPTEEDAESGNLVSFGMFKLTYYCPCQRCCGLYANGITATGTIATAGRTISVDSSVIPLGSTVLIDGQEYIAEDTGVHGNTIDVYVDSHQEALNNGVNYAEVFVER